MVRVERLRWRLARVVVVAAGAVGVLMVGGVVELLGNMVG